MSDLLTFRLKEHPLSIALMIAITILSLAPMPEVKMAEDVPLADKWVHMAMYGSLSLVVWYEHRRKHSSQPSHLFLLVWALAVPVLMGGLMELAQAYLTTVRSGDWWDFVANSIGASTAWAVGMGLNLLQSSRHRQ